MTPQFFSISDQVALHGLYRGDEIAFIEGERCETWSELNARANRIAHALIGRGVARGDRIAVLYGSQIEAYEVLLGIWRAGAAFVPLSPMLTPDLTASLAKNAGAKLVITNEAFAKIAAAAQPEAGFEQVTGSQLLDASQNETATGVANAPDDLATIIYSSGTTGTPKGIAHNHAARRTATEIVALQLQYNPNSVAYLMIPPHSNGAFMVWGAAFAVGFKTVLHPAFDVPEFFGILKKWKPTHGFLIPTICNALIGIPGIEKVGLECFDWAITAGAPMPERVKTRMIELTGNGLAELWGLTESVASVNPPSDMQEHMNTVGRPVNGVELRIIDEDGKDITQKGVGEIVGRSNTLMDGYWEMPQKDAEATWISPDGVEYFRTGDLGEIGADGRLILRGRNKEMLISGGLNVYPVDIEATFMKDARVADVAVVGVPHDHWGETPIAFVVAKPDLALSADDLKNAVNENLAKHQRVSDVVLVEGDFPRNTLGKPLKQEMRASYLAAL